MPDINQKILELFKEANKEVKTLAEIGYIKHLYEVEGKSLRTIAKETGMDFRTVKKYAYMENFNTEKLPNIEPLSYPILGPYIETINQWLLEDSSNPRKQTHTKTRIYNRLVKEKGFTGSYSSVRRYVAKALGLIKNDRQGEKTEQTSPSSSPLIPGFLPLSQPLAHSQIDFGDCIYENGLGTRLQGHAMTLFTVLLFMMNTPKI